MKYGISDSMTKLFEQTKFSYQIFDGYANITIVMLIYFFLSMLCFILRIVGILINPWSKSTRFCIFLSFRFGKHAITSFVSLRCGIIWFTFKSLLTHSGMTQLSRPTSVLIGFIIVIDGLLELKFVRELWSNVGVAFLIRSRFLFNFITSGYRYNLLIYPVMGTTLAFLYFSEIELARVSG